MKVLVIDDDEEARALISRSLGRAGHTVAGAGDVKEALGALRCATFDVVVLDVGLPDGSGLTLCRRLREDGVVTPILFLSARGAVSARVDGLEAGGDDYLVKPFALKELHARLRALCRRGPVLRSQVLRSGDVVLDFATRHATRGGVEVPVTAREWDVLEALASLRGRPMGYDDLLEAAWGDVSESARASLPVIIARLRRKLHRSGRPGLIRTVRGLGYALAIGPREDER